MTITNRLIQFIVDATMTTWFIVARTTAVILTLLVIFSAMGIYEAFTT